MPIKPKLVIVNDKMQKNYKYYRTEPEGKNFDPEFKPYYTPQQMLSMGVFEGRYVRDCIDEFPASLFKNAKFAKGKDADESLNYFKVKSRQSLQEWQRKGWIIEPDKRGWAEWYFRYYYGRRIPEVDEIQISRWKKIKRHEAQVKKHCPNKDPNCRPKQRQTLLQWAYNPYP